MSRDNPAKLLEDPQSLNLYAYARNNPLKYVDVDGRIAFLVAIPVWTFAEAAVDAIVVSLAVRYITSSPPLVPNILDNTPPPLTKKEPYTTPQTTEKGINNTGNTTLEPAVGMVLTTLGANPRNISDGILETPAYTKNRGDDMMTSKKEVEFNSTIPRDPWNANYLPDPAATGPHTTLGIRNGTYGKNKTPYSYTQGATFDANGNFLGRTDVTDHHRGDHYNPHFHKATSPNGTEHKNTPIRGGGGGRGL